MAYQRDYYSDENDMPNPYSALAGLATWVGAGYGAGIEKKMAAYSNRVFLGPRLTRIGNYEKSLLKMRTSQKALGIRLNAGRIEGAINLANKSFTNIYTKAGWDAAARSNVTKQFAKIALSRTAATVLTGLNVAMWAPMIFEATKATVSTLRRIGRQGPRLEFGGDYSDTRESYTERQRAVRAISSSRMSIRSAIGNEAMLLHR